MKSHRCRISFLLAVATVSAGCSDSGSSPVQTVPELIEQARAAAVADPAGASLPGLWRVSAAVEVPDGPTAHVDLIWVVGERDAWHVVEVFADEAMTVPLARWDIVRSYALGGDAAISPQATELDWTDRSSWIEVFIDSPELLAVLGVNDCSAVLGEARDTSVDNCAAPFFPFRECTLMDFAELDDGRLTFGDPQATDRCVERVSSYEAWTFERVSFTAEIEAILGEHPADLL